MQLYFFVLLYFILVYTTYCVGKLLYLLYSYFFRVYGSEK
jgi:hypothetical protein